MNNIKKLSKVELESLSYETRKTYYENHANKFKTSKNRNIISLAILVILNYYLYFSVLIFDDNPISMFLTTPLLIFFISPLIQSISLLVLLNNFKKFELSFINTNDLNDVNIQTESLKITNSLEKKVRVWLIIFLVPTFLAFMGMINGLGYLIISFSVFTLAIFGPISFSFFVFVSVLKDEIKKYAFGTLGSKLKGFFNDFTGRNNSANMINQQSNQVNLPKDQVTKIKELHDLFVVGAITKDEYEEKKKDLLAQI
jgi:hypothetical protein